jgi:hypothetical protein
MREMDGPLPREVAFNTPLYISFDMDALDRPLRGVSHPSRRARPGRASPSSAQSTFPSSAPTSSRVQPDSGPLGLTAMTAAKLVKEIAARMLETPAPRHGLH